MSMEQSLDDLYTRQEFEDAEREIYFLRGKITSLQNPITPFWEDHVHKDYTEWTCCPECMSHIRLQVWDYRPLENKE